MRCIECMKPLPPDATKRRKFCDDTCRQRWNRRKPVEPIIETIGQAIMEVDKLCWYADTQESEEVENALYTLANKLILRMNDTIHIGNIKRQCESRQDELFTETYDDFTPGEGFSDAE